MRCCLIVEESSLLWVHIVLIWSVSAGKMPSHMPQIKNEIKEEGMLHFLHKVFLVL